jgi:hypothetical protein
VHGPMASQLLILRQGQAWDLALAAAHRPIRQGSTRPGRSTAEDRTGMNAYGPQAWTRRRVSAFEGRSRNGRHTTQPGLRSALTAGPCSNSLYPTSGFPVPEEPPHAPLTQSLLRLIRCPGVIRRPSHGNHGPRCLFWKLRPETSDTRSIC